MAAYAFGTDGGTFYEADLPAIAYDFTHYDYGSDAKAIGDSSFSKYSGEASINDAGQVLFSLYDPTTDINTIYLYDNGAYTRISNVGQDSWDPKFVGDGKYAYMGWGGSNYEIFLWDNGALTQISDNYQSDWFIQANQNGQILWRSYDGTDFELYLWNGVANVQLSDNSYEDYYGYSGEINSLGQVVWYALNSGTFEVYYYDGTSTHLIGSYLDTGGNDWDRWPQINDQGQVVWAAWDGSDQEIFLYHNGVTSQLTDTAYSEFFPRINNQGEVAWHIWDGSDGEIVLYRNGTATQITDNPVNDFDPLIYDNGMVLWRGEGTDVYVYQNGAATLLTHNFNSYYHNFPSYRPSVDTAGQIVWLEYNGSDTEVYLYQNGLSSRLAESSFSDSDPIHLPQINNAGQVVWSSDVDSGWGWQTYLVDPDTFSGTMYASQDDPYYVGDAQATLNENGDAAIVRSPVRALTEEAVTQGQVYVNTYYDGETGQTFTPVNDGLAVGANYLGSEADYIVVADVPAFRLAMRQRAALSGKLTSGYTIRIPAAITPSPRVQADTPTGQLVRKPGQGRGLGGQPGDHQRPGGKRLAGEPVRHQATGSACTRQTSGRAGRQLGLGLRRTFTYTNWYAPMEPNNWAATKRSGC